MQSGREHVGGEEETDIWVKLGWKNTHGFGRWGKQMKCQRQVGGRWGRRAQEWGARRATGWLRQRKQDKTAKYRTNAWGKTSLSYATAGATVISSGLKIGWLARQIIFEDSVNNSQVEQNPSVPKTATQYTVPPLYLETNLTQLIVDNLAFHFCSALIF